MYKKFCKKVGEKHYILEKKKALHHLHLTLVRYLFKSLLHLYFKLVVIWVSAVCFFFLVALHVVLYCGEYSHHLYHLTLYLMLNLLVCPNSQKKERSISCAVQVPLIAKRAYWVRCLFLGNAVIDNCCE